jgi:hypothetical protein
VRPLLPTSVQGLARHRQCSRSCMVGVSVACRLGTPHIDSNPRQGARRTATCPIALDPASLLERVLMLPHEPRHWILPPCSAGLRRCHVSHCTGPTSLLGRASVLSRAPWLRTPPHCLGGLRYCHMLYGFGPYLPAREGSSAVTCPTALDPASLLGRAPALPLWISVGRRPQE